MRCTIILGAVAACLCSLPVKPVHACSCAGPERIAMPRDGASEVPRNVRIWVDPIPRDSQLVRASDRAVVPLEVQTIVAERTTVMSFTPRELLDANTSYEFATPDGATFTLTFTTGSEIDDEPPDVPRVVDVETHSERAVRGSSCKGNTYLAQVSVRSNGWLFVVDRDRSATLEEEPAGSVMEATTTAGISLGTSPCLTNWPGAKAGSSGSFRFGAYDLAGNFSGWSEPRPITLDRVVGCRVAGNGSAPTWLIALLACGWRRRSR